MIDASTVLYSMDIRWERDVVAARQRARQIADQLGFDVQEQTRVATACSEIARNAFQYAAGGKVDFLLQMDPPQQFVIVVSDHGKGIADAKRILDGRYRSPSGMGLGIIGAKRLMDSFEIESDATGTRVSMAKKLPRKASAIRQEQLTRILNVLTSEQVDDIVAELQQQNRELLRTLEQLRLRQAELDRLNRELDDTNRGVVALYAELDERAGVLQRTSELKSHFLSNMSHEFRTPLNSIISLSQLLLDRVDGVLAPEQEKQVSYIRQSADSLLELVNDLLDMAKIEAGKATVRVEEFSIEALFGALRGMLRPLTKSSNVKLLFESSPELPTLSTDETKVSQILRNFISNALKFTVCGEVRVSAHRGPYDTIVFDVADTGIGLAAKDLDYIFEEFTQIENPMQIGTKGTGLGLPLTRKFAELLGGRVQVKSELGKGAVFSAILPRIYHEQETQTPVQRVGAVSDGRPQILIVDDDEISRYLLRSLIGGNFHVRAAENGADALRLIVENPPDVVFLDLVMPELSGFEVLNSAKSDPRTASVPIVIHTSMVLDGAQREQLLQQAVAIVPKHSVSREESISHIREALRLAGVDPAQPGESK